MISNLLRSIDSFHAQIKVTVRDVGHGNWNEIQFGSTRIFFDIGAQKQWRKNKVRSILDNARIQPDEKIFIFLSHWDTDHYHAILGLTDIELKSIKGFVAPNNMPDTNTADQVKKRLEAAGIRINLIPFTNKKVKDKKIELNLNYNGKKLKIFRSTNTNNRNLNSIVFHFDCNGRSLLLSGDQNYEKLFEYVINQVSCANPMILLLPHHGGSAGKFKELDWRSVLLDEIVISYHDSNTYGHPLDTNIKVSANLLSSNKLILTTNDSGDKVFYF